MEFSDRYSRQVLFPGIGATGKDPRLIVVRARDPDHGEYGTLILAFIKEASAPAGLRLYGWTAIDAQGKRTMVRLSDQHFNVPVPASAFTYAEPKKKGR